MTALSISAFSQSLKTFNGSFSDGKLQNGTAVYTYYEDQNTHEYLKQGAFKYTFKGQGDYTGYDQTITGNFEKGLKTGTWTYIITMTDFGNGNPYATGTITLIANYKNGYADGNWKEVRSYKNRKKYLVYGQYKWEPFEPLKTMIIDMNFKDGFLVGAVNINDEFANFKAKGSYDNNSLAVGTWVINDIGWGKNKDLVYKDNYLYEFVARSNSGEVESGTAKYQQGYDNLIKASSMSVVEREEAGISIDTVCGKSCAATSNIQDYFKKLLVSDYFLYEYIKGDLTYDEGIKGGCELTSNKCDELAGNSSYAGYLNEVENYYLKDEYVRAIEKIDFLLKQSLCKSDIKYLEDKKKECIQKKEEIENFKKEQSEFYQNFEESEYDSLIKFTSYFWEKFKPVLKPYSTNEFNYPINHPKSNNSVRQNRTILFSANYEANSLNDELEKAVAISQLAYYLKLSEFLSKYNKPEKEKFLAEINTVKVAYENNKSVYIDNITNNINKIKIDSLNTETKKKILFKKYEQLFNEYEIYILNVNNPILDRVVKSNELVLFTNKIISLYDQNTEEIEKQLKDAETAEQIMSIISK